MRMPKNCKVEIACEKKGKRGFHRTAIQEPYIDTTAKPAVIVATDGQIMAVVPIEAEKTEHGYISEESIKAARKLLHPKAEHVDIQCNGNLTLPNGQTFPRPEAGTFPKWRDIAESAKTPAISLCVNAAMLATLSEALGTPLITLHIADNRSMVKVTTTPNGPYGFIMPLKAER